MITTHLAQMRFFAPNHFVHDFKYFLCHLNKAVLLVCIGIVVFQIDFWHRVPSLYERTSGVEPR